LSHRYRCTNPVDPTDIENIRSRRPKSAISDVLPYEDDLVARVFVAMHPNGATLEEVGAMFDVTRERIRQIEAKAIRKLQAACAAEGLELEDFLVQWAEEGQVMVMSFHGHDW
jgi:DNA-directed RNA polymerase sigma subunit (sigma70/sigma32)